VTVPAAMDCCTAQEQDAAQGGNNGTCPACAGKHVSHTCGRARAKRKALEDLSFNHPGIKMQRGVCERCVEVRACAAASVCLW
jgi:hypothetical protein